MTTFGSNDKFIELHRTFHELPESSGGSDNESLWALPIGHGLSWSDLIEEHRLIILSEAGSGKTTEILNVAHTLRDEGKPAFFLRLEDIPRDLDMAFEVGTFEAFEEWLDSVEEGWLLLDSVDEARLGDPRDFERAIRKLGRRISTAKDRAHIVITSRTTAWRPKTDLACCTAQLPYTVATTSQRDQQPQADGPEGSFETETETQDRTKSLFKIVSIDDLTRNQIAVFVERRGIKDSKAFLDAVERADAWSFTSRPQDLEALTGLWIEDGRIGTRLELMKISIDRRLEERDRNRAEARPFELTRARHGSRLLAAATTLCKEPSIRVPDGAENSRGIAVKSVLPDWDDKDQLTLLSRPIFDEATYGAVRFHDRSVREYLTAEWFDELLKLETSRRNIESLFFRKQYGLDIIVPTLRPILPWLAILDEKIRERVRSAAPEIFFEGGDPSQLPLEVRSDILHGVCKHIAEGTTDRSIHDYAAVQRFANRDLTGDIRSLIREYADNNDLTAFLLHMVWLGQLEGLRPEAMKIALTPTAAQYVRMAAFRAVDAIGSDDDRENVRKSFLEEASELKREWLAELLESIQPTRQTLVWLLACLEKSGQEERRYAVDPLTESVTEFADSAALELLPQLVKGLNGLLDCPSMIQRRYCEVPERFRWLLIPASKALERLMLSRHPASLAPDALLILRKLSAMSDYRIYDLGDAKTKFSELVPAWTELNRALFWFEVKESRDTLDTSIVGRLTEFWQAPILQPFWRFTEGDFEYAAGQICTQQFMDDKLVALSLAFSLYKAANRPRAWREQLKKSVSGNDELSGRLRTCLRPPAQSKDSLRWKQREAESKRRDEANRKKQEEYHTGWKNFLNDHLDEWLTVLHDRPGTLTKPLIYLLDQLRDKDSVKERWAENNWKMLIPDYGQRVARFYRDATVSFWRNYQPTLRSEGAPLNKTPYEVVIGLTGLEIEAHETKDWLQNLSPAEIELACKYASFELNGFPTWFPKLFETYPNIVSKFLMQEIRYELSTKNKDKEAHYVLSDVSWSGQWAWDQLAPSICELLNTTEPENLFELDELLKILQGSNLPDDQITSLASEKCRISRKPDHVARWFAIWTGVAPDNAILALKTRIEKIADRNTQTLFAMTFLTNLWGGHRVDEVAARKAFKTPEHLKSLYMLMREYIRHEDDINHTGTGTYSPELRDYAQEALDRLFDLLTKIPGKESFLALNEIAKMHPQEASRARILLRAKRRAEQDGDIRSWSSDHVRDFYDKLERTPSNHSELADLAILRLLDLKDDLENGDASIADILQNVKQETDMRKYIGKELREKSFGRYSIPQEEELADAKKPDLRFHGVGFDGPVPAELKLADKWTGPDLFERLENQLCGDYLRDSRSRQGIFLLVWLGDKGSWEIPGSCNLVDFAGLTEALQNHWSEISSKFTGVDVIKVIGIDLTKRRS